MRGSNGTYAQDSTPPVSRPGLLARAKKHWTALTFLGLVAAGGFSAAMLFAQKADATDVKATRTEVAAELKALDGRLDAEEKKSERSDEALEWIKESLKRIEIRLRTQQEPLP